MVGETTDVSIGDAWLDKYVNDFKGANVLIVRNKIIDKIIKKGIEKGRLKLDVITKDDVIKSQDGGIRHRREGLSYRLFLKEKSGEWVPKKRVEANKIRSRQRRNIYRIREKLRENSHKFFLEAKKSDDLEIFKKNITKDIEQYRSNYLPLWKKIIRDFLVKVKVINKK